MPLDESLRPYFKPHYPRLLCQIQAIQDRAKRAVLQQLSDGQWHSKVDLLRAAKRMRFIGDVSFGMMMHQMQDTILPDFILQRNGTDNQIYYKIRDNYVGLTRAAYKYDFRL